MATQLFCTGPAHIFVGAGSSNSAQYFGTTETTPNVSVEPRFREVTNDIGGEVEVDDCYQGKRGLVRGDFTRWDQGVLDRLRQLDPTDATATDGLDVSGDIGSLMVTEKKAYPIWILFPYQSKPAFSTMRKGYRFAAAYLTQDSLPQLGTKPHKISLVWKCLRVYKSPQNADSDIGNPGNIPGGAFLLYDEDMNGLPAVE